MSLCLKYLSIIAVFSLLLFCGCKKSSPGVTPYYAVDSGLTASFNYQPGTYWIYRDSLSGRVDSFYVTSNTINNSTPKWTENINIPVSEKNIDGTHPGDSATMYWTLYGADAELAYNADSGYVNPVFDYRPFLSYPLEVTVSDYVLNGNSYSNVAEILYTESGPTGYNTDRFFVNDTTGIIKMSLHDVTGNDTLYHVWELQRYSIKR